MVSATRAQLAAKLALSGSSSDLIGFTRKESDKRFVRKTSQKRTSILKKIEKEIEEFEADKISVEQPKAVE